MASNTHDELSARIAQLEAQVASLQALLDRFVTVDEESSDITLSPSFVRCEMVTVYQWWTNDADEYQELDRIRLFVDDEKSTATVRLFNESGKIAYDIEACDAFVATEHYHNGRLKLAARANKDWSAFDTLYDDGKTFAARIVTDGETFSELRVIRPDATNGVSAGVRGRESFVSVWDCGGNYPLLRLFNAGNDLGSIEGWRSGDSQWLQMNENASGNGGRLCMWSANAEYADFYVLVDPQATRAGLHTQQDGVGGIELFASPKARFMQVLNFLGKTAHAIGVDAAGNRLGAGG